MEVNVRVARKGDVEGIIGLRLEAEQWLAAAGVRQWVDTQRGIDSIRRGVSQGDTYLVTGPGGEAAAALTLAGPDTDFWRPSDDPGDALYLYKFMVSRAWAGTGLGAELLDWSCQQAQDCGVGWLRLDCWRTNTRLHNYYQRQGFALVRTMTVAGRSSGALFERPARTRMVDRPRLVKPLQGAPGMR